MISKLSKTLPKSNLPKDVPKTISFITTEPPKPRPSKQKSPMPALVVLKSKSPKRKKSKVQFQSTRDKEVHRSGSDDFYDPDEPDHH